MKNKFLKGIATIVIGSLVLSPLAFSLDYYLNLPVKMTSRHSIEPQCLGFYHQGEIHSCEKFDLVTKYVDEWAPAGVWTPEELVAYYETTFSK